jgi:UDP-N-acetylmuramyl pentapeptide phosphotransferase/UDP-N-acetylglucosamine-1-phosphate transferase
MEKYTIFIIALLVSQFLFRNFKFISKKLKLIDNKNLHYANNTTPTGSGIIFLLIFILSNIFYFYLEIFNELIPNRYYFLIISAVVLSITSFIDDIKPIDPILRLLIQFNCIYISLSCLNLNNLVLPFKLSILLTFCFWVYVTNITNFIDGTDGFLVTHALFFFLNILTISFFNEYEFFSFFIALMILPSLIIFFFFNKPNARLFMGDAGSIFLGFLIGYCFFEIFLIGYWQIALSLLSYPLLDCTICLIKKLRKGIMPWIGMYDYYFLKPALHNKKNHKKILTCFVIFNILNSIIIFLQIYNGINYLFLLSFLLSIILMNIYNKFKNFSFFSK